MDENKPTFEELQQILDENTQIIQIIMKNQSEGRMMDCLLYQTRLHLNLIQLASIADNRPHPCVGIMKEKNTPKKNHSDKKAKMATFIQAIKENGMKDLDLISEITSIPPTDVFDLCMNFIDFLKRQNRYSEASKYESDLEFYNNKVNNHKINDEVIENEVNEVKKEASEELKEEKEILPEKLEK